MRRNLTHSDTAARGRRIRETLAGQQVRLTQERELILDGVMAAGGHFGADDLVFILRKQGRRVSRATVYRTLDLLVQSGVIQRVSVGEGGWQYEVMEGRKPHAHLYCVKCGKLMDYPVAGLEDLHARVGRETKFKAQHHMLRICGICRDCQ